MIGPNRLQMTYQRNMILGLAVATMISVIAGLVIISLNSSEYLIGQERLTGDNPGRKIIESPGVRTYSSQGSLVSKPYPSHEGFVGFVRLEPKRTIDEIIINTPDPSEVYMNELAALSNHGPSFSGGEVSHYFSYGEDDGFGLPEGATLIEIASDIFSVRLPERKVLFEDFDELPILKFIRPVKYPERALMVSGTVCVEFVITKQGNVDSVNVLAEEPKALGFAEAVRDALNDAECWPGIMNGEQVSTTIYLDIIVSPYAIPSIRKANGVVCLLSSSP